MFIRVAIILALGLQCQAHNLPANIQKCKYGDNECITKMANILLPMTKQAIPELNLPVGDPMPFVNLTVTGMADASRPVFIKAFLENGFIYAIANFKVKSVTGFEKDPRNSKIKLSVEYPTGTAVGNYSLTGKILLFPIQGRGFFNLTTLANTIGITFDTSVKTIDGEDYLHVKKVHTNLYSPNTIFDFEQWFPKKDISDTISRVVNENQQLIFDELQPSLSRAVGKAVTPYVRKLFMAMPYRKFFAEE